MATETVAGTDRRVHASETIFVPVPSIGLVIRYNFLPRLQGFGQFDWFYLEAGGWKGSLLEFLFGLEYRVFDHVGIGAALNRLNIEVDGTFTSKGREKEAGVTNDWNIIMGYFTIYL